MNEFTLAKRAAFTLATALLVWLAVELCAVAAHRYLFGDWFDKDAIKHAIRGAILREHATDDLLGNVELRWGEHVEVVHPYLGYVSDPAQNRSVSDLGFFTHEAPGAAASEHAEVVAIFGGSFAGGLYRYGAETLRERLSAAGIEARVVNFAAGGYKQPQQLQTLSYLYALGVDIDVVVNVDGVNEVILAPSENVPKGVHPSYPRQWYYRGKGMIDAAEIRLLARAEAARLARSRWALRVKEARLYRSPLFALVWRVRDRRLAREVYDRIQRIEARNESRGAPYVVTGPPYAPSDPAALHADLASLWERSSRQMDHLARGNGDVYVHLLQPNQYVPDSKPMSAAERQVALNEQSPYRQTIRAAYPLLMRRGAELAASGVHFVDATGIARNIEEPLYKDDCCHMNDAGYRLVAARVAEEIVRARSEAR